MFEHRVCHTAAKLGKQDCRHFLARKRRACHYKRRLRLRCSLWRRLCHAIPPNGVTITQMTVTENRGRGARDAMRGIAPVVGMSLWHGTAEGHTTASCAGGYEHYRVSLEASLRIPQRERVCARQEPRQRHRERANLRFAWSFAKRRLAKFNNCSSAAFVLHLKKCALATKFQAVAQRRPAVSYQETVQEGVS